jgi:uncharacterized protein YndB with AHSA1/START domain
MTRRRDTTQTLSQSIRIAAPPERVWDMITTVAGIAEWYDTWDAVEHAAGDERLQVGTSFRLIRYRGDTALCRVTSVQPGTRLCWVQHAAHLPTMSVEFELAPETDGAAGTLLSHTRSWLEPSH